MIITETEIRLVGGLAFLFVVYSFWMGQKTVDGLPDNYDNPVLALELVKNGGDIKAIVGPKGGEVQTFLKLNTKKDFGFIVVYAISFVSLSLLLARMRLSWAGWAGWLAAASAVSAAVLDLIEDRGMLKAITGEASDPLANSIRYPSLAKWSCLFIFSLLVGLLLMARRDVFVIPAVLFLLAALLGMAGVFLNLHRPRFYWMFPAAIIDLGLGILFLAIALTFWPGKFLDKFPIGT